MGTHQDTHPEVKGIPVGAGQGLQMEGLSTTLMRATLKTPAEMEQGTQSNSPAASPPRPLHVLPLVSSERSLVPSSHTQPQTHPRPEPSCPTDQSIAPNTPRRDPAAGGSQPVPPGTEPCGGAGAAPEKDKELLERVQRGHKDDERSGASL